LLRSWPVGASALGRGNQGAGAVALGEEDPADQQDPDRLGRQQQAVDAGSQRSPTATGRL
jgi:hypothetical protein